MTQYTKQDILNIAKMGANGLGGMIDTDGIRYDTDGKGMAEFLSGLGFAILRHFDTGRNGLVLTQEGVCMSTNGYCYINPNQADKYDQEQKAIKVNQLKNAIWQHNNGMVPIGGMSIEWYREQLFKLTGETKGYHED